MTASMQADYLQINAQKIAAETIEGEVVIVNFVNGNYYALNHLAADIWHWLVDGHSVTSIAHHIRDVRPQIESATISEFVGSLLEEDLLEACDESPGSANATLPPLAVDRKFAAPVLEKHEDMQKLILLDPIHEVDDSAGWPHKGS